MNKLRLSSGLLLIALTICSLVMLQTAHISVGQISTNGLQANNDWPMFRADLSRSGAGTGYPAHSLRTYFGSTPQDIRFYLLLR